MPNIVKIEGLVIGNVPLKTELFGGVMERRALIVLGVFTAFFLGLTVAAGFILDRAPAPPPGTARRLALLFFASIAFAGALFVSALIAKSVAEYYVHVPLWPVSAPTILFPFPILQPPS